jgi:uncharacterized delta-60 repeat protein
LRRIQRRTGPVNRLPPPHSRDIRLRLRLLSAVIALIAASALPVATAGATTPGSGSLYTSFGKGGFAVEPQGSESIGVESAVQADGKIVVVGESTINGTADMIATRLNANGTPDSSFGSGGWAVIPIGKSAQGNAIAFQSDGDIVLAGAGRDPVTGTIALAVARLTPDGVLDPSFGDGGVATVPVGSDAMANGVVVQGDGKIVVSGTALTDHNHFVAARLNSDGTIDTSFGSNGVSLLTQAIASDWGLAIQTNGELVLGGDAADSAGNLAYMVARLQTNGNLDTGFGQGGIVIVPIGTYAAGLAVTLQSDGKILLTGNAIDTNRVVATVRFNTDGTLDSSFGQDGIATFRGTGANAVTMEGTQILLAGPGAVAIRLNPTGTVDTTFGKRGFVSVATGTGDAANGITVDPLDNTILLAGVATVKRHVDLTVIKLYG